MDGKEENKIQYSLSWKLRDSVQNEDTRNLTAHATLFVNTEKTKLKELKVVASWEWELDGVA